MQFRLRNFMMATLAVLAIAFTGCDPEETTLESASLEVVAQDGIDTVSVAGGEYSIAITTNRDWTITSSQEWVSVDPEKGSNTAIVTVTVLANDDAVRKATLTITASTKTETIEIYQEGDGEGSWVVPEGSESVQGFYASASGDSYTLEDVVIDYQSGSYNFVSAGGKTVLVYDSSVASSAKVGDKISVTGTVSVYYDVMQLQYPATVNSVETSACDITPIVLDAATFGVDFMDYQNQLVCFENVTISGTTMTQADGSSTSYYNKLAITAPTSGTYDVVGYGAQYSGAHQIYPVAFLAVGEGKNYTPVVPEDDGTTDNNNGTGDVDDVPDGSESVQGFYAATSGDSYTLVDVVIDYQNGSYNYVSAGGKSILVYDSDVSSLASVGDKVSLTGSVSVYYDVMQLQYPVTVNSSATSTCDITPIVVDVASFGASYMAYQNQLVCFENATTDGSTITQDGSTTAIYNKFSATVPTSGTYDIIGYAAQYSGAHQIYPIAFLTVGEGANYTPDTSGNTTPDFEASTDPDGGEGDENNEESEDATAPGEVEGAIYQEFFGTDAVSSTTTLSSFADWYLRHKALPAQ